ncbi:MAG: hypothetical protein ABIB97_00925 [Patescibacteria group bacterium]
MINSSNNYSHSRQYANEIILEIFKVSLVSYFLFSLLELIKPGMVSHYFNQNVLLQAAIVSGIILVSFFDFDDSKAIINKNKRLPTLITFILAVIIAVYLYLQLKSLGIIGLVFSLIVGAVIILIPIFLSRELFEPKEE